MKHRRHSSRKRAQTVQPEPTPNATLDERNAAPFIDLSIHYLRRARREGRGPAFIRIGRSIRYRVADLEKFLSAHRVETHDSRDRPSSR